VFHNNFKQWNEIQRHCQEKHSKLLHYFEVVNLDLWLEDMMTYGKESINNLCSCYRTELKRKVFNGFQDYVGCGSRRIPEYSLKLLTDC